ncbi:MAG: M20/M25/M40 family metallo-hydrolase [Verrucomicrobiales bacterium]|nr:M20/M25/M40 family metallo-hydrolase [Verrucomicrobiales bacterium]
MNNPDSVISLLQELVKIPSVNPDSAPGQDAPGEKQCAERVGEFLKHCGAEVSFEEVLPGRPNVIGRFPGGENKPGLLFAPHTDTVSVRGMTIEPFSGEIRDGKLFGRGASDTKGTMAAMLWSLHELREVIPSLSHAVTFVGLMGEEAGQPGAIHFAEHHADEFSFAVVGEPTGLETVHASKGCVWLELSTEGVSCHGSTPERGENAIRKLLPVLEPLLVALERELPSFSDPVLGNPTVSLGEFSGGSSPNIVPSSCRAVLDFRETPAFHAAGGCEALVSRLLADFDPQGKISTRILGHSVPLFTDPETDGVKRLQSIGSKLTTAPWFCDAGRLGEKGLAAVAVGPGNIAQAHTKDEFLAIEDLENGVKFYSDFIRTFQS